MGDQGRDILDGAADRLLRIPGVHGVAFGRKFVGGVQTETPAILVFTHCKRRRADVLRAQQIPSFIDKVPTDVFEMSPLVCYASAEPEGRPADEYDAETYPTVILHPDAYKARPIVGGLMISTNLVGSDEPKGTLGCVLTPSNNQNIGYALSCHHVFFFQAASQAAAEPVFQPVEDGSTCCAKDNRIGTLVDTKCDDLYDIALIALRSGTQWRPAVRGIGIIKDVFSGVPFDKTATTAPALPPPHVKVQKYGVTTGLTGGEIFASGMIGDVKRRNPNTGAPMVVRAKTKGFLVQPRPMAGDWKREVVFAAPGDSGAAVLTLADNKIVGLLTGGARLQLGTGGRYWGVGYVTPIQVILDRYSGGTPAGTPQLVVATTTSETDVRTVPGTARVALPEEVLLDRTQAKHLEEKVRQTSRGNLLADLYWAHARNVKILVDRNRRVATAWHRCGVAFVVQQLLRAYRDPSLRLPPDHDGRPLLDSLKAFFAVLARFGDDRLKADVARFSALVPDVGGMTFGEILDRLGNMSIESVA